MNKKLLKAIGATVITSCLCFGVGAGAKLEAIDMAPGYEICQEEVMPFFIAITRATNKLSLNSGGCLTCYADTCTQYGYGSGVTIELQQYTNDGWRTIKTWTSSSNSNASILEKDWYVAKGYSYQLKTTHTALSNGNVIESFTKYSNIINYF